MFVFPSINCNTFSFAAASLFRCVVITPGLNKNQPRGLRTSQSNWWHQCDIIPFSSSQWSVLRVVGNAYTLNWSKEIYVQMRGCYLGGSEMCFSLEWTPKLPVACQVQEGLTLQNGAIVIVLRYEVRNGHQSGTGGHQQATKPDDTRTVESVAEVAEEDDEDAITDLRDGETKETSLSQWVSWDKLDVFDLFNFIGWLSAFSSGRETNQLLILLHQRFDKTLKISCSLDLFILRLY